MRTHPSSTTRENSKSYGRAREPSGCEPPVIVAADVQYLGDAGFVAAVAFPRWTDAAPEAEHGMLVRPVAEYEPGQFFKRELPCLLAVLGLLSELPEAVIVDGYVWLDGAGRQGLGALLFEVLGGSVPVVGVAKRSFRGSAHASAVLRGSSTRPLFVTAAGLPLGDAAAAIAAMHGTHRTPTLLKRVDQLCRQGLAATTA